MNTTSLEILSSDVTIITVDEPLLRTRCRLGEGPIWDPRTQTLHFIDIDNPHLYHYRPESGELEVEPLEEAIGCLALRKSGGLACAAAKGFALVNDMSEPFKLTYITKPLSKVYECHSRFNDGACDPNGIFWAGVLEFKTEDGKRYPGQLWRFDPLTKEAKVVDEDGITDSNAIGWSADHKTMYFVNSTVNLIHAYDYDVEAGMVSNRRNFIDGDAMGLDTEIYGNPDGFCIDREGCLWVARWKGSRVVRFTPDGKGIDLEIHIPKAYSPTACCFGGPDMDKLFITSASPFAIKADPDDLNARRLEAFPDSGNIFMVDFANLPQEVRDNHKGVPLGPRIGDFDWRHMYPY